MKFLSFWKVLGGQRPPAPLRLQNRQLVDLGGMAAAAWPSAGNPSPARAQAESSVVAPEATNSLRETFRDRVKQTGFSFLIRTPAEADEPEPEREGPAAA